MPAATLIPLVLALAQEPTPSACDLIRSTQIREDGRAALAKRQFDSAVRHFQEALAACPAQSGIRLELANAYFVGQRFKEAIDAADGALQAQADRATALKIKANSYYFLGDESKAESTFIEVLERYPNDEEAAYMLGRVYYQENRVDHAIGQFQRVLKLNPKSYKAYDNLGLCYQALNQKEEATRYFLASIRLVETDHPDYDWPYANLASLLLDDGQNDKAFSAAVKAVKRNPGSARNCFLAGKALFKLEKPDLSMKWLERSVALDPNYPDPLYLLSRVYGVLGEKEKAEQTLKKFQEVKARTPRERK